MHSVTVRNGGGSQTEVSQNEDLSSVDFKASSSLYALKFPESTTQLRDLDAAVADPVSMVVVFLTILVSEAARGLMLPSQWPYLQAMGGNKQTLGLLVASFSFGRMLATIPLGFLSDHLSMRDVLAYAGAVQMVGHAAYMVSNNVSFLIGTRVVVGLGSATMSVCRAHIARSTSKAQRTYYFAYLSALQFVGFAVLPAAGGLLAELPRLSILGVVELNEYTYPALVLVFANGAMIAALYKLYRDPPTEAPLIPRPTSAGPAPLIVISSTGTENVEAKPKPDMVALMVCLLINICFRGMVAELETVASPVLMGNFHLSLDNASYDIGFLGFLGFFVYMGFKPIAKRFSDRQLVLAGLGFAILGSLLLCQSFVPLPLWSYSVGLGLIWSLAFPVGQTAVLSLFSKVLAGLPAGGFLGVFSACGSLARVLFAISAATIWDLLGERAVFGGIAFMSIVTSLLGMSVYRRLVPPGV